MNIVLLSAMLLLGVDADDRQTVITVVGASGTDEYGQQFQTWAERWREAADRAEAEYFSIGTSENGTTSDREELQQVLQGTVAKPQANEPVWLVFIGHGTFDGRVAKFNLRGEDVSAAELAAWLQSATRPLAVINCASASGSFINALAGPRRVIVTATKSGLQLNFARFGDYLSRAIVDTTIDLDKDEQTSLLEAFLAASSQVQEFYHQEGRLATEHALLDDNGDGRGTPAAWFRGTRATKAAKEGAVDGLLANQLCLVRSASERDLSAEARSRRDELEAEIAGLRKLKEGLSEQEYYAKLEAILIQLAQLYAATEQPTTTP